MFSKTVLFAICVAISHQKTIKGAADYSGCGGEYQCFGLSDGCVDTKSCEVLLKTKPQESGVEFDLVWDRPPSSGDSWVAAALSHDQMMGDDSASVFSIHGNQVNHEEALTFVHHAKSGTTAGFKPFPVKGVDVMTKTYTNGVLHAKWVRTEKTTIDKLSFDMKANKYYIFLAQGPMKKGKFLHHTDAGMSDIAVSLE